MKLYLISQEENCKYGTYDSAVVAAFDEDTARHIDPDTGEPVKDWDTDYSSWCSGPEHVVVRYLGEAAEDIEQGVVCASFRSG